VGKKALQFITQCHTYFRMKSVDFLVHDNRIRIYFALGYIGGKAGEWAQQETETLATAEYSGEYPDQLKTWDNFREYFLLTWMDITSKDKARRSFFTGEIKQTQTARAYGEFFKKRVLEVDYPDSRMVWDAFFWGLKDSVRESLVTHPEFRVIRKLDMLITLATVLDEVKNSATSKTKEKTEDKKKKKSWGKAENGGIGTGGQRLSDSAWTKIKKEGLCIPCYREGYKVKGFAKEHATHNTKGGRKVTIAAAEMPAKEQAPEEKELAKKQDF
jgi:hypothetical protein